MKPVLLLLFSTVAVAVAVATNLRGSAVNDTAVVRSQRKLMTEFAPLSCNSNIDSVACDEWDSQITDTSAKVVIPCGQCVVVGCSTPTIDAPNGIDVQGKLKFLDYTQDCPGVSLPAVTITTPFLHVQGVLEIKSARSTTDIPDVKIIMTGTSDTFVVPYGTQESHNVGKKAIAVAGGRLDIRGLPQDCTTWTNLLGTTSESTPVAFTPQTAVLPEACDGPDIISVDWADGTDNGWTPNHSPGGSQVVATGEDSPYFIVVGRTATWQGPALLINDVMDCILPDTTYYITAQVRLTKTTGTSNCQAGDRSKCIKLTLYSEDSDPNGGANTKAWSVKSWGPMSTYGPAAPVTDGEWFTMLGVTTFTEAQASTANMVNRRLYFEGAEAGVDIAVKDFRLSAERPAQFSYSGDTCSNLVPFNNDGSSSLFPYPFPFDRTDGSIISTTESVNGVENHYFALSGRKFYWGSLRYNLETSCIKRGYTYTFSMKLRINSSTPTTIRLFRFREEEGGINKSWKSLKDCGELSVDDGWVTCSVDVTFDEGDEAADLFRFSTETDSTLQTHPDIDYDDVNILFKSGPVTALTVASSGIDGCWGAGSEMLITSHTLRYEDYSTATLASVTDNGDGSQTLSLQEPYPPSTVALGASTGQYASEVALLSRNIVWEGADDEPSEPLHGGHLIVLSTPGVAQTIEGLELRRFGQQTKLGRYPIHFHMSGSVTNSVVSKNLIRNSFQRCIVIHGSHEVTISNNVAFDTMGHCFMLEDGGEKDSVFEYNLGAVTKVAELIRPEETDDNPSTYWITNPQNTFRGNVAAGSHGAGFWFELRTFVRAPSSEVENFNPSKLPLKLFTGNIAHSNRHNGIQTYPGSGYNPDSQGLATFENSKSFRNYRAGIFFHNSRNLHVEGGLFADNRKQIDIDRAPGITVNGPTLVGFSPDYRTITSITQASSHCPSYDPIVGVQMHTYWSGGSKYLGAEVKNTNFEHLGSDTGCIGSSAFNVEYYEDKGYFDIRSFIESTSFDSSTVGNEINFCQAEAVGIDTVAIQDLDSSILGSAGFIVSNSARMTAFWPSSTCAVHADKCAAYCPGVCYRAWGAAVSNFVPEDLELEVSDGSGNSISVKGAYDTDVTDTEEHTKVWRSRRFFAQLPAGGQYSARFVLNGQDYWPIYVEHQYEDQPGACGDDFASIDLLEPDTANCEELIKNGDMSLGIEGWWSTSGGLKTFDEAASGQGLALGNEFRYSTSYGIAQFVDTRCLTVGAKYTLSAKVKMYTSSGAAYSCSTGGCPQAYIKANKGTGHDEYDQSWSWAGALQGSWQEGEWNEIEGEFIITAAQASAHSAYVYFNGPPPGVDVVFDDVSISPTQEDEVDCDASDVTIISDSFDGGSFDGWTNHHSPGGHEVTGEENYFIVKGRTAKWQGPRKILPQNWAACMESTATYTVSAKVRLTKPGGISNCEGSVGSSGYGTDCVRLTLFTEDVDPSGGENIRDYKGLGRAFPHKDGDWFDFVSEYKFTESIISAEHFVTRRLYFEGPEAGVDIAIDDFKIERVVCGDTILAADFSAGTYLGWNGNWSPGGYRVQTDEEGGNPYFITIGRSATWQGPMHDLPVGCTVAGTTYTIAVRYRLTRSDGLVSECQSSGSKCLQLTLYSKDQDGSKRWKNLGGSISGNDGVWYEFETTATFDALDLDTSVLVNRRLYFSGPEAEVDIAVDDFKMEVA